VQRGSEAGWLHMRTWRGESDRSVSLAAKRRLLGSPWSKGGDDPLSLVRQEPEISRYEGPNMDESCNLHLPRQSSPTQTSHTMLTRIMPSSSRLALMPIRTFTTIPSLLAARKNFDRPSPPPLPPSDQAEFDALLKANQSIGASPAITSPGEEVQHRDLRRGPKKDFEGDVDPKTGERGGPKVDPFKAGDQDWQYGGRVTVIRFTVALSEGQELTWLGRSGLLKHCHPIQPHPIQ